MFSQIIKYKFSKIQIAKWYKQYGICLVFIVFNIYNFKQSYSNHQKNQYRADNKLISIKYEINLSKHTKTAL